MADHVFNLNKLDIVVRGKYHVVVKVRTGESVRFEIGDRSNAHVHISPVDPGGTALFDQMSFDVPALGIDKVVLKNARGTYTFTVEKIYSMGGPVDTMSGEITVTTSPGA